MAARGATEGGGEKNCGREVGAPGREAVKLR